MPQDGLPKIISYLDTTIEIIQLIGCFQNNPQVQPLLQHKRWDARIAAGECIGLIAEHAQHPTAPDVQHAGERMHENGAPAASEPHAAPDAQLQLEGFDLERVLKDGTPLLASGGEVLFFPTDADDAVYPAIQAASLS